MSYLGVGVEWVKATSEIFKNIYSFFIFIFEKLKGIFLKFPNFFFKAMMSSSGFYVVFENRNKLYKIVSKF